MLLPTLTTIGGASGKIVGTEKVRTKAASEMRGMIFGKGPSP